MRIQRAMVVLTALCAVHVLGDAHTHDGRAASAPSSAAADGHGLLGSSAPPPPTPTGEGGHCPFFSSSPGSAVSGAGSSVCAQPAALRKWQGLKFGLFLHWGAYSQIGFDASWSLNWATVCTFGNPGLCAPKNCSECTHADMQKFRDMYWGLSKSAPPRVTSDVHSGAFRMVPQAAPSFHCLCSYTRRVVVGLLGVHAAFNPTKFNPEAWASSAKAAGMKYFVMTTKHHDGFAMYNTSAQGAPGQPVYGVTGPDCPTQRDLYGEVAAAMRAQDMFVGAYYSKADWHSHSFWDPSIGFPTDRNVNYDIATNASKWQQFVDFDKAQFVEIQEKYSPDMYWLDAGWVGQGTQYLPLADWAQEHRKINPQQLWVNRDGGVVEDYLTPENPPPSSLTTTGLSLRPKPWEVCMTLGQQWAYNPHDVYKTTQTVVQTLVSVVATGGSLLLDIGPMPTGELPPVALQRLAETGEWMKVNSESIYETMPQSPYAMDVTGSSQPGKPGQWGLLSPSARGESAACDEPHATNGSAVNPLQLSLAECQAFCGRTHGCNTINFRAPSTCIPKSCSSPGAPLATKDGGWDVYCLGCAEAVAAESWRLTRKADFVYATLLLANDTLPMTSNLSLPFVVNVPGGVDGSWPLHTLASVTLLGAGSTSFKWSEAAGLVLSIQPGATAPSPFAAVFKLDYSVAL